jgi:hypothetical protein
MLATIGDTPGIEPDRLTAFWPMVGHAYNGSLMVVGRAVNGWVDHITVEGLQSDSERRTLLAAARASSEGDGSCPMGWVTYLWGKRDDERYSTARSAFWRHIRAVLAAVDPSSRDDPNWSSRLAWSNLTKVAPAQGGNPGGALLDVQRQLGPALLLREVLELAPRRVLVLTGRWWFEPFVERLNLDVEWRPGLVEGIARQPARTWVIAGHPQGKPRSMLDEVIEAFERAS